MFSCKACHETFGSEDDITNHFCQKVKGKRQSFFCPVCNRAFSRKPNLRTHLHIHTGQKRFTCNHCARGFARRDDLEHHILSHTVDINFCQICNKSITNSSQHVGECEYHTGKELHICEICGKDFSRRSNLKIHMLGHFGEKRFECGICQRAFARKEDLEGHILSHNGLTRFSCTICNRGFARKGNYMQHLKVHKRVFSCEVCNEYFHRQMDLKQHLMMNHSEGTQIEQCNTEVTFYHEEEHISKQIEVQHCENVASSCVISSNDVVCEVSEIPNMIIKLPIVASKPLIIKLEK